MSKKEFRFLTQELRAAGTDSKPRIQGYAARFDKQTTLQPGLREVIRKGAFRNSIARQDDCWCCFNHDQERIISRVSAGSLRLKEDDLGLYFDSDIDLGVGYASDLYRNIKNGNVSECSFGFRTVQENYVNDDESGSVLRELLEVSCFDVSPVIEPAYGNGVTSVTARSLFPEGMPQSIELRCQRTSSVEVSEREIALMRARVELAKRS